MAGKDIFIDHFIYNNSHISRLELYFYNYFLIISSISRYLNISSNFCCLKFVFPFRKRDIVPLVIPICSARSIALTPRSFIASLIFSLIIIKKQRSAICTHCYQRIDILRNLHCNIQNLEYLRKDPQVHQMNTRPIR